MAMWDGVRDRDRVADLDLEEPLEAERDADLDFEAPFDDERDTDRELRCKVRRDAERPKRYGDMGRG